MAGFGGLKVFLLWAGLHGLARCKSSENAGSTPPSTPPTTPTITSISHASSQILPHPGNQSEQNCSYSVENIPDGLQIKFPLAGSLPDDVIIYLTELLDNGSNFTYQRKCLGTLHNSTGFSCPIDMLRPCTNYSVSVKFGNETCEQPVRTGEMKETDIKTNTECVPGYLCYESRWNITDIIQTSRASVQKCQNVNSHCINLTANDFCSELKTNFSCFSPNVISTPITLDLFERSSEKLKIDINQKIPVELIWANKPKNCNKSIEVDYSCQATGIGAPEVNISMLEPFTEYNCTGRVKLNSQIIQKTGNFPVNVNCSLNIKLSNSGCTNTSISLNLNITSEKCPNLQNDKKLSHNCSCCLTNGECKPITFGKCGVIEELQPFQKYVCNATTYYNGKDVVKAKSEVILTKPGIPEKVEIKNILWKENNHFIIDCKSLPDDGWKGPQREYIAFLEGQKQNKNKRCNGLKIDGSKIQFVFKDLHYWTNYKLTVIAFNGHFNSTPTEKHIVTRYNDKAAIGILGFLIILTLFALIFIVYKIFLLHRKKHDNNGDADVRFLPSNEDNLMNLEPIAADFLLDAYRRKIADEGRLFLAEFQSIPRIFSNYSMKEARRQCNQAKNRYVDILPYDHNRVRLSSGRDEAGGDYINASFIDGYKESKKYIAAQGPKEENVADFWRMIWEQQSSIIVMVTRCEESNRSKCAQYWPMAEQEAEIFDEFVVKLNKEDLCPDYIIRRLSLTNRRDKSSEREVTHIQFISWPDHGVPGEPHLLLKLRRRVNDFKNFFSGPIVIHCSAGVGRTGTYISIDAMMEGLESGGQVDIYGYVVGLRRQRSLMVQVEAQYILIHQALIEHNQFGETEISLADFHSTLTRLLARDPGNEPSLLEAEFQRLPRYKNWRTFNMGATEVNRKKNRYSSVIPYDYNRVLVKMEDENSHNSDPELDEDESSDEEDEHSSIYINASHIDGYWCPRCLIAAQGPLPHTSADFWQMVYEKKANVIVMLSNCREGDQEFCSAYWGDSKMSFGEVEVEVTTTDESSGYTVRTMQLRHAKRKENRKVKQYHFLKWAGRELPEKSQELTDMIRNIKQACGHGQSQLESSGPVVVHCNDGSSRSGVFCALWNLVDCVETEKMVDVFQVAKALRKERQGMIGSLEQYQFLYEALDRAFPVQNGKVKQAAAPSATSVQIVNEAEALPADRASASDQQGTAAQQQAEETVPLVADSGKDTGAAETKGGSEEPMLPSDITTLGDASNGPLVTVDL